MVSIHFQTFRSGLSEDVENRVLILLGDFSDIDILDDDELKEGGVSESYPESETEHILENSVEVDKIDFSTTFHFDENDIPLAQLLLVKETTKQRKAVQKK